MSLLDAEQDSPGQETLEAFVRFCASLTLENGEPFVIESFQRRMLGD